MKWCKEILSSAKPLHPLELQAQVKDVIGKLPSKDWHQHFLNHSKSDLCLGHPKGLDSKWARNFNKVSVTEFFDMQKQLEEQYNGIPPEHHWNVDKKGCQMGGRKNIGTKYIFSQDNKGHYQVHSDNLELVTILECVNASGTVMPPWFDLTNGPAPDIRDLEGQVGG